MGTLLLFNRNLLIALAVFSFCSVGVTNAQFSNVSSSWTVEDIGTGIKPSFDFGPDGRIHVMGMTEALSGAVWHADAATIAGPWNPTTLSNGYFYGPGDLRVDSVGTAHVAWHDHDREDAAHAAVSGSGVTTTVAVTPGTHDGWDNAIAVTSTDRVRMSSIFPSGFGAAASLVVGELEGDTWKMDTLVDSGSAMYGLNTSIGIDSSDQSHVLYTLADGWTGPGSVNYARQDPSNEWQIQTIEGGQNIGRFPSIAIDANDQVHAAWINAHTDDETKADVRYATLEDEWQIETVATLDNVRLGFSHARKLVSLDVDGDGNPHLAYGDQDSVTYATRSSDSAWQAMPVVETESPILNGLVVLRLDNNDAPGIAFWRPIAGPTQGVVSLAIFENEGSDLLGDFDLDGKLTASDVDAIGPAVGTDNLVFDLNNDAVVDLGDRSFWVTEIAGTLFGDANLDKDVDFSDFLAMSRNFRLAGGWSEGNFDGVGNVDFADFLQLSRNFGEIAAVAAVPEPTNYWPVLLSVLVVLRVTSVPKSTQCP